MADKVVTGAFGDTRYKDMGDGTYAQVFSAVVDSTSGVSASNPDVTSVASSASSVTLKAANTSRKQIVIYNDSTSVLYVKYGITASNTSYTIQLQPYDTLVEDGSKYNGRMDGIWATANGNARVTETS